MQSVTKKNRLSIKTLLLSDVILLKIKLSFFAFSSLFFYFNLSANYWHLQILFSIYIKQRRKVEYLQQNYGYDEMLQYWIVYLTALHYYQFMQTAIQLKIITHFIILDQNLQMLFNVVFSYKYNFIMTESPRKRVLTDIGSDQTKSKLLISKVSQQRMSRVNKVFKFTPVHSHQIQTTKYQVPQNISSRINQPVDCLDELNSMFQLRKISNQQIFSADKHKSIDETCRSKSKINKDIENSIQYIQNIKSNHNILATSKTRKSSYKEEKNKKKQDLLSSLGLQFQQMKPKTTKQRYLTEPAPQKGKSIGQMRKSKKFIQVGLYSYLQRDFIQKKQLDLNEGKMVDYAKNPNNYNFHRVILQKSRRFLKKSAQNKFRQINKIKSLIQEQSKKFIQQQLKMKRQKYARQYKIRNNVPYFSYLTLSEREKQAVLSSVHRKRSIT